MTFRSFHQLFALSVLSLVCLHGMALSPGDRVDNFKLLDHEGHAQELYYLSDAKAVVFMVQGNGCPIVRNAMPRFKELRDVYQSKGIEFRMINANLQDNRTSIAREVESFGYDIPILVDDTQIIGEALGLVRTGEVFVVDPKTWKVAYVGAVDDRLTYENQKKAASKHYLADALDAMIAGEPVATASTDALGCLINLPERDNKAAHQEISYTDTIAPMMINNCISCHRVGGIGSWAMTDYNMVRGFAPMIREVVRTKRMPPWHADPMHGEWANDRSLTNEEVRTLVHWIEAGAPRGEGNDPLAEFKHEWPEWSLGEPDLVIEMPAQLVPATGVVDYQYPMVPNPLDHDVWVRAAEIIPGDRSALHHVITNFGKPNPDPQAKRKFIRMGTLGGYVPGAEADVFPAGTGSLLPAGTAFVLQMHYTSYGKETTDRSKLGLYFHKEKPQHELVTTVLMNTKIRIPANTKAHTESAAKVLEKDVLLYSLLPHSHFRGVASDFVATYPNGEREILLSVPAYDFNWQTTYNLKQPKILPAGTRIEHSTTWDNSAQNLSNPDPNHEVTWGEQSWEEMLFGAVVFRVLDEAEKATGAISAGQEQANNRSGADVARVTSAANGHTRHLIE